MSIGKPKENNFDLIRLLAAFQILAYHCIDHFHFASPFLYKIIYSSKIFSGIIILFTISGFLIFASFDNNPDLKNYLRNRFLRVFPGLWVCTLFTISILVAFGYINSTTIFSKQFWFWVIGQASFFQFYTPGIFRPFGVGNPNGSLWTISVELSFYIIVPFIFWLFRKTKLNRNIWLIILIILSVAYNVFYQQYRFHNGQTILVKLLGINLAPYLFYFLLGSLAYINWERIKKWYIGKGFYWLFVYLVYCLIFSVLLKKYNPTYWTDPYQFTGLFLLSQTAISMAFTYKNISTKILRHNDISYGVYVYHMPIINVLLTLGYGPSASVVFIVIVSTTILACLSWKFVEKPALLRKKKTMNKLT